MDTHFENLQNKKDDFPTWDNLTDQPSIDKEFPNPTDHLRSHHEEIEAKKWKDSQDEDEGLQKAA